MKDLPRELLDFMIVWPFIFAASSAACIWFRRRNRARLRRQLEGCIFQMLARISGGNGLSCNRALS